MKKVYLDHNATTPLDPRVFEKMKPYFLEEFGNPSSESHAWGWNSQNAVETARKDVAQFLNCKPHEIIFTSGSTESVNMALLGTALECIQKKNVSNPHFITTRTEHSCVLAACEAIKKWGGTVDVLDVNSYGQLEIESLLRAFKPETILVSTIWVNNETGTLNDIEKIGQACRERGVIFHTDATQAPGKVEINLQTLPIDLLSLSGHKAYGPKGVGALFLRSQNPRITLTPLVYGGGQERSLRPGTQNVPGIVGLGEALRLLHIEWRQDCEQIGMLRDKLYAGLKEIFPDLRLNTHPTERAAGTLNVSFPSFSLDLASSHLLGLAASRGSACQSGSSGGSHVLKAMGVPSDLANRTLRLSLGKTTTQNDIDEALNIFSKAYAQSRRNPSQVDLIKEN